MMMIVNHVYIFKMCINKEEKRLEVECMKYLMFLFLAKEIKIGRFYLHIKDIWDFKRS